MQTRHDAYEARFRKQYGKFACLPNAAIPPASSESGAGRLQSAEPM